MILGVIQARMSSTRLPGKVMLPLLGRAMLARQIERLKQCQKVDTLVVATSDQVEDQAIVQLCLAIDIPCICGDLNDVLDRFHQVSQLYPAQHIVRFTADCPLCDAGLIDDLIEFYLNGRFDYASTALKPSFPDGLDAEVFRVELLDTAWNEARLPSQREHVTSFFYSRPERFFLGSYTDTLDRSAMRWTVDEPCDFEFVSAIYQKLYPLKATFDRYDIYDLLVREPELMTINSALLRNSGYKKSLELDELVIKREKL